MLNADYPQSNFRSALMADLRCASCGATNDPKQEPTVERDASGRVFCNACGFYAPKVEK